MTAESPAFDVARERARQPTCEAWFFFFLSFIVAHLFLFPLFAGVALWHITAAVAARVGSAAWVVAAAAAAAYAATYFDGAEASGRRLWPSFSALWAGCHPYFPVRVLIWDADSSSWQAEPVPGHARTLPLAQRTHLCVRGGGRGRRRRICRRRRRRIFSSAAACTLLPAGSPCFPTARCRWARPFCGRRLRAGRGCPSACAWAPPTPSSGCRWCASFTCGGAA
jgi:hypothetical protein